MSIGKTFYTQDELEKIPFRSLGANVEISRYASITTPELIDIGDNVRIPDFCFLSGRIVFEGFNSFGTHTAVYSYNGEGVVFEKFTGAGGFSLIMASSETFLGDNIAICTVQIEFRNLIKNPVRFKKQSGIASFVTILPGTVIGEGSMVMPHSCAKGELESWKVYKGCPAVVVGRRKRNKVIETEERFLKEYVETGRLSDAKSS